MSTQKPTVEVLYAANAEIGEGPFYEEETNQLIWVDISGKTVNLLDLETKKNKELKMPGMVGAAFPVQGSDKLLVFVDRKICLVDRETGAIVEELAEADTASNTRLNDGKCDSSGRLWCGTMDFDPAVGDQGAYYSFSKGKLTKHVSPVSISNGIGWTNDNKTMYYVDSLPRKVYKFDFDVSAGTITNQRLFIDYNKEKMLVVPDGMCTDTEGRLWIASFGGSSGINCWDPDSGKHLQSISMPGVCNVTSCCFGGPNYEWLFVTSANVNSDPKEYPNAGHIFLVKDLGARGTPSNKFKL